MDPDDALLPISALQHLIFCRRQCALIHLEGQWAENRLTAEGRVLHRRVHEGPSETRGGVRLARRVPLRSLRLGLFGVADLVEMHPPPGQQAGAWREVALNATGSPSPTFTGWRMVPVESKRGRAKRSDCDRIQLCAQALCLEEMLAVVDEEGAIFYGKPKRREAVIFDAGLRRVTEAAARELHALVTSGRTPPPETGPKCRSCSLRQTCLPEASADAKAWLSREVSVAFQEGGSA